MSQISKVTDEVTGYVAPALAVTDTAAGQVIEDVTFALDDSYATPGPVIGIAALSLL